MIFISSLPPYPFNTRKETALITARDKADRKVAEAVRDAARDKANRKESAQTITLPLLPRKIQPGNRFFRAVTMK